MLKRERSKCQKKTRHDQIAPEILKNMEPRRDESADKSVLNMAWNKRVVPDD